MLKFSRYISFLLLVFCTVAHASGMFAKATWWEMLLFGIFVYGYLLIHSLLFWGVITFIAVIYMLKKINSKQKKKNAPPDYNWVCPECGTVNQAHTGDCTNCHINVL